MELTNETLLEISNQIVELKGRLRSLQYFCMEVSDLLLGYKEFLPASLADQISELCDEYTDFQM